MADKDLKRVGLIFTADGVVDYKKSLKECSAATKENYQELKLAQSQYDKNTSVTTKLKDKQAYLAKQTEVYSQKVKVLTEKLSAQESAETKDEAAIRKTKTALAEAQAKLNGYQSSLNETTTQIKSHAAALEELGGKVKNVGGKISGVGDALTKGVTVPVAAVATASVAAWKEVDEAMDTVTKKTGASGAALKQMQTQAKHIAETIPTSFQSAADAIGEVNTRFGLHGKQLETLSTQYVKFAKINDTDVTSAIDSTQSAMAAFDVQADQAGDFLDTLTKVSQDTGKSVSDLSSEMVKNSTALKQLGMDSADAAVFLGNLSKTGLDSSTIMTALGAAQKNAAKNGMSLKQALGVLQQEMDSTGSTVDKTRAVTELFGSKAGAKIAEFCINGKLNFKDLGHSLGDFSGTVSKTYDETVSPLDKLKPIMNELKDLGAELVETAAPMIVDVLKNLKSIVENLKASWDRMSPSMQLAVEKFFLFAAAAGPALSLVGRMTSGVGGLIEGIGKLSGALASGTGGFATFVGALKGAGSAIISVLGAVPPQAWLVIAVIAAVVAAGVALYKNWDSISKWGKKVWSTISGAVVGAAKAIKDKAGQIITGFGRGVVSTFKTLATNARTSWDQMSRTIVSFATKAKNGAVAAFGAMKSGLAGAWTSLRTTTATVWGQISTTALGFARRIGTGVVAAWKGIPGSARTLFGRAAADVQSMMGRMQGIVGGALQRIKAFFGSTRLTFPQIRMPHFSVKWHKMGFMSIPTISVKWYRKAMDVPYLFRTPTVFGTAGGLKGAGEAGDEIMYGRKALMDDIGAAVSGQNGRLEELLTQLLAVVRQLGQMGITLDSGALVGALTPALSTSLGTLAARRR